MKKRELNEMRTGWHSNCVIILASTMRCKVGRAKAVWLTWLAKREHQVWRQQIGHRCLYWYGDEIERNKKRSVP